MRKNIGYNTRDYYNSNIKISGGSFNGQIDMETVERLTHLFTVKVLPSGTPVFVDKDGHGVRLYITVDAGETAKGKEALKAWCEEKEREREIEEARLAAEEAEIEEAMEGLSHEEIMRRLRGES